MFGFDPQKELEILYNNLPKRPYAGNYKAQSIIVDKDRVYDFNYIQYNHPEIAKYIVIDFDDIAMNILDSNLSPNLLVFNHNNPKGHAYYRLKDFVGSTAKSRMKPQKALRLITHSIINYSQELGAGGDHAFNGQKAKNPLSSNFKVFSYNQQPWEFDELFDNIPDRHIYTRKPEIIQGSEVVEVAGRNCYLFELTRHESYKLKAKFKYYAPFFSAVESFCLKANGNLSIPLAYGECKHIIKSVANWTWLNYTGDCKNRGVLELDSKGHNLTLQDKQSLGAGYTNKIRTEATEQRIVEAVEALQAENVKITQKAIAERSGLHRNTLRNHSELIKKLK